MGFLAARAVRMPSSTLQWEHRFKRAVSSTRVLGVLACGFLVADVVVAGLERIAEPGEIVYAPRGVILAVGGHPANVAVDLVKLGADPSSVGVCGAVGGDILEEFL